MFACVHACSLQPRPTLGNPMDCSPPGSSVRGILQARTLEWVAVSFFQESFLTQGWNPGLLRLLHCRRILTAALPGKPGCVFVVMESSGAREGTVSFKQQRARAKRC